MVENSVVVVSFLILFTTSQTVGLREVETALSLLPGVLKVLQTIWPSHLLTTRSLLHEATINKSGPATVLFKPQQLWRVADVNR